MEAKVKPHLQSNISFDLNFEVKAFPKYIDWINTAAFIIKCLLGAVAPFSAIKQLKESTIAYNIQILWVLFHLYVALF